MGSDFQASSEPRDSHDTTKTGGENTSTTSASACETGASWGARRDLTVEHSTGNGEFADAINELAGQSDDPTIAVSSHMDRGCVWMVAFSSPDAAGASAAGHATAFTPMLRHPAGLWTAAPQSEGWLRIVDRASRAVWIPLIDVTGSATYGDASCASFSAVRVSAAIPASAAGLALMTAAGERTVRELMGSDPSVRGWDMRLTFSAAIAR